MHPAFPKCTLLFRNAPDSRENAPRFSGMHPTLRKMHPAFSEMHPEKSKMHPSLFFGAFFYQNMSTKPTERQGYVPTQIIEKREILTVRVSLSHFYPTLIRQLPSHFCFKTLLWVLAQAPPLRYSWIIVLKGNFATRPVTIQSWPYSMAKTSVLCHCEPVTDVTGVAIRISLSLFCCFVCTKERRIPTPVLRHWLGMTGVDWIVILLFYFIFISLGRRRYS